MTGMYRIGMCTGTETPMFRTSLNTGHFGRFRAFWSVSGLPARTKKAFFYSFFFLILSFVIFEFL